MNNSFTCLVKSKPVKQKVSCLVILSPMVSVLCCVCRPRWFFLYAFTAVVAKRGFVASVQVSTGRLSTALLKINEVWEKIWISKRESKGCQLFLISVQPTPTFCRGQYFKWTSKECSSVVHDHSYPPISSQCYKQTMTAKWYSGVIL